VSRVWSCFLPTRHLLRTPPSGTGAAPANATAEPCRAVLRPSGQPGTPSASSGLLPERRPRCVHVCRLGVRLSRRRASSGSGQAYQKGYRLQDLTRAWHAGSSVLWTLGRSNQPQGISTGSLLALLFFNMHAAKSRALKSILKPRLCNRWTQAKKVPAIFSASYVRKHKHTGTCPCHNITPKRQHFLATAGATPQRFGLHATETRRPGAVTPHPAWRHMSAIPKPPPYAAAAAAAPRRARPTRRCAAWRCCGRGAGGPRRARCSPASAGTRRRRRW
jgi:hypothetical protein